MTIEGRISVDATFHDKSGDESLNVVSLVKSREYLSGKVAIISGMAYFSPAVVYLPQNGIGYRDASGEVVTFSSVSAMAVIGQDVIVEAIGIAPEYESPAVFLSVYSSGEIVSVTQLPYVSDEIHVRAANEESSYTLILYGQ